jgi:eukaryotic translation initiation factor 2C
VLILIAAAPAAYAHVVAARYRKLVDTSSGGSISSKDGGDASIPAQALQKLKMTAEHSMFFC